MTGSSLAGFLLIVSMVALRQVSFGKEEET